jgi:hypothetical protein
MMQNDGAGFLSGAAGGFFGSLGATAWGGAGGEWKGIGGKYAGSSVGTIAFGALSGGVGAELSGGNFWKGAIAGGIVAGLNDVMHGGFAKKDSEVVIMEDTEGAGGKGHMAVGGGNDKKGWKYVSKYAKTDANGDPDGGLVSGGKSTAVLNEYGTRNEMMNANSEYDKVIRLKCTYKTAMKVINGTYKAALENYHFMMSNCTQAVGAGLNAAGIFSGSSMVPNTRYLEIAKHYYPWGNPSSGAGGSW